MYITELMKNWTTINIINRDFKNIANTETNNMTSHGELILQTTLKKQEHHKLIGRYRITTQLNRHPNNKKRSNSKIKNHENREVRRTNEIQVFQQQKHTNHRSTSNGSQLRFMEGNKL